MTTFLLGIVVLLGGGLLYGKFCEHVFGPDDRETPAYYKADGVDYVPMKTWKNSLINLLNIAGTGPILGPIQGILFGPIAFITIPIGNIIGGAMHDYFCGMICTRDGGTQMPEMIRRYTNKGVVVVYRIFLCILLLLVGAVFVYTPGDIAATQLFHFSGDAHATSTWIIYAVIFAYYLIATVFPIDKIIGRIYPIFGAVLLFSTVGIFVMTLVKGLPIANVWDSWNTATFAYGDYFFARGQFSGMGHFVPIFFVTVSCGILSGFHSTQTALVSRTMKSEKNGRMTFYNMMILEGFIAMVWAAATMGMIGITAKNGGISMGWNPDGTLGYFAKVNGTIQAVAPTSVVGVVCRYCLGSVGSIVALLGVIVLPITSGDTALRALRLTVAESFHIKQEKGIQRVLLSLPIFVLAALILVWSKFDSNGFQTLWNYFAWSNQTLALFALPCIAIYLAEHKKARFMWMPMIPAFFYGLVCSTWICQAKIGFHMSWTASYAVGFTFAVLYCGLIIYQSLKGRKKTLLGGGDAGGVGGVGAGGSVSVSAEASAE